MPSTTDIPTQLSDVEALMWALEADPHLSSNFANVSFLDRLPDVDRLRRRLWRATHVVPLLRMKVVDAPRPQPPRWVLAEDFDIDEHLHHLVLPDGATEDDVLALATEIAGRPFVAGRPLWEFTVVEGLPGGRAAMVQKMHHTITDGEGGIRMSLAFVDFERDAPEPAPIDDGPPARGGTRPLRAEDDAPGAFDAAKGLVGVVARRGLDAAGSIAGSIGDAIRDPSQLAQTLSQLPADSAATARSLVRQLAVVDHFRSPLWTERSLDRSLHVFDVSLADVKAAGERCGASVNDVFVAAACGGAGAYHRDRGADVADLRISMPVSTRTDGSPGGNAFTPTRVLVPLDADPRRRLAAIHERLAVTKQERALSYTAPLAGLTAFVPPAVLLRLARQQVATVDFAASNLKAAPMDLFIGGALLEGNYPVGPIAGTAWNITTMSYRGQLNIGVHVDTAAVADPADLVADIRTAFSELIALA